MKPIQTLEIENTIFHIGKDENGYWGINHKYVEGSEAKGTVNGLEGNCSEDYLTTVRLCWLSVKRNSIAHLYDENNPKAWIYGAAIRIQTHLINPSHHFNWLGFCFSFIYLAYRIVVNIKLNHSSPA